MNYILSRKQFDVLTFLEKTKEKVDPMIRFLENPIYNEANNIASALIARYLLSNAYVFGADLFISNPAIIKMYNKLGGIYQ